MVQKVAKTNARGLFRAAQYIANSTTIVINHARAPRAPRAAAACTSLTLSQLYEYF